nr:unnamed protein product [Digitaria exilis]
MASMQSWRKAYGAIKDTTTVSLANLNSDFKDLDVAIVKATNHVECPPKERHLRKVVAATSIARPRADVAYCIHALSRRLAKTRNWIPEGAANNNYLVQYALALVLKESFKIYCAINDGIINLVDKFFEMPRHEALKALEIYRRAGQQAGNLSDFYENCRGLELARNFQFPTLREPPQTFLATMEEYVREAPRMVPVREPLELPERLLLTYKPEESEEIPEPAPVEEEKAPIEEPELVPPVTEVVSPPPKTEVPDTVDLLGLSDLNPVGLAIEENNALALAIVPTDGTSTTGNTAFQDKGFDPTGWELALVTAPSNTTSSASSSQLGGGFDKLILDSLYDDGAYRQRQQQQLYGSAAPNPFMTNDPFAMSNQVAPPPSVQMAAMSHQHQQIPTMMQPNPFGQPIQPQMGMGPATNNPFLDAGFGPFPVANNGHQQHNPFGGAQLL